MNVFAGLLFYMAIGGVLCGMSHTSKAKRCGAPQKVDGVETALVIATWPGVVALAAFMSDKNFTSSSTCDKTPNGEVKAAPLRGVEP